MKRTQIQEKLLQETKYSKWYLNIIQNAQSQNRTKLSKSHEDYIYYENHHILPKSIFIEYSNLKENSWNSVLLTSREHVLCHKLIFKHYDKINFTHGKIKMAWALEGMRVHSGENLNHSEETKEKMREFRKKNGVWNKGKTGVQEAWNKGLTKENSKIVRKMSDQKIGNKNPMFGRTGKNHHNSDQTILFDNIGNIVGEFESKRQLSKFCSENSIPLNGLYKNKGVEYLDGSRNGRYVKFNGWRLISCS